MAYTFEQIEARDPANPELIAANALVTIFAPGDPTMTPLTIYTPNGMPIENPVQVNSMGYGPAFMHATLGRVAWSGGEFTGFFTAHDSIKQDAVAAAESAEASRLAAEEAARNSVAPTTEAVAAALTTEGPAQDAISVSIAAGTTNLALKPDNGARAIGKGELVINVRDYGAKGDGSTDDTAAINLALSSNPGQNVFIPAGRYMQTAPLAIPAGTTLAGQNGAVLVSTASNFTSFITAASSFTSQSELAAPVGVGSTEITTKTAHGLQVGDVVQFRSQRVSTSDDAKDFRLGYTTANTSGPYFGEYATVYAVTSPTAFTLDTGLIYPGYRHDATEETDPGAGTSTIIRKMGAAASKITVRDLTLEGPSTNAIRFNGAIDCLVENVRYTKPDTGRFIQFQECFRTEARGCWIKNDFVVVGDENHDISNSYHVVASQSCGFDSCTVIRGTQCFDFTYSSTGRIPSTNCYVRNSKTYSALFNCATSHPGTYGTVFENNDFADCRQAGLSSRSRRSLVVNNRISGSMSAGRAGLYFTDAAGVDSLVSGNQVTNFDHALAIHDGGGKPFGGQWIGIKFTNNDLVNFNFGFKRTVSFNAPHPTSPQGVTFKGNTFRSRQVGAVGIETVENGRGAQDWELDGNTFSLTIRTESGTLTNSIGVLLTSNAHNILIRNNNFMEANRAVVMDASAPHVRPSPCRVLFRGNDMVNIPSQGLPVSSATLAMEGGMDYIMTVSPEFHLDNFKNAGAWRAGATADATLARGFPEANMAGYWYNQVVGNATLQYFVQTLAASNSRKVWYRRYTTTWSAWTVTA